MIPGDVAYCDDAYASQVTPLPPSIAHPLDPAGFQAMLDEVTAERRVLIDLSPFSLAPEAGAVFDSPFGDHAFAEVPYAGSDLISAPQAVVFRYSDHGYTSNAADSPASTHWEARALAPLIASRGIPAPAIYAGLAANARNEVSLANQDGLLDTIASDYAMDNRAIDIRIGKLGDPLSAYGYACRGRMTRALGRESEFEIEINDGSSRLDVAIQQNHYAGTGGDEGGLDVKGKPKPLCYGNAMNVTPVLVDRVLLRYQVHDGAISDVPAAYDEQIPYTRVSGTPSAGQYSVDTAAGFIRLGGQPAGILTCDVLGDATPSYTGMIGPIIYRICSRAGFSDEDFDPMFFSALTTAVPGEAGIYIGNEPRRITAVVEELLLGCGCYGAFGRQGKLTAGALTLPVGTPIAAFDETNILAIERLQSPDGITPRVWRVEVGYARNYTVQDRVAAGAATDRRAFAVEPYRSAVREDLAVKSQSPLSRGLVILSPLAFQADAQQMAINLFDLYSPIRKLMRVEVPLSGLSLELGDIIMLTYPRFGLANGSPGRVVGYHLDLGRGTVSIEVFV